MARRKATTKSDSNLSEVKQEQESIVNISENDKLISFKIEDTVLTLKKSLHILQYRQIIPLLSTDIFEALDKATLAGMVKTESDGISATTDNLIDEDGFALRALFHSLVINQYFNFEECTYDIEDDKLVLLVGSKSFTVNDINREQYKSIYNLNLKNPLLAWEYIYTNCVSSEDKLDTDNVLEYVSGFKFPELVLNKAMLDLKKK